MRIITAPERIEAGKNELKIFLAGSIEQGTAELWQDKLIQALRDAEEDHDRDLLIFNPRRKEWDPTWTQSKDNPQFAGQVNWELDALEAADVIVVYFDPATKSPITLMELGLHIDKTDCVVCCPPGYWRKGNVDIVCERFGVPVYETLDEIVDDLLTGFQ